MKKALVFIGICLAVGCVHEPPTPEGSTVELTFNLHWGGEAFEVGNVYTDELGHHILVSTFKAYFSEIALVDADGVETPISNIEIVDFTEQPIIAATIDPGDYTGLIFGLGVPEAWNKDVDPIHYESDHPLSAVGAGASMFWFWNTGYIFMKFDGQTDLTGGDPVDLANPFAFHCGDDFLYQEHEFTKDISMEYKGTTELVIDIDVKRFLHSSSDTIDLEIDFLTHTAGNPELATRFMNLVNEAISLQ